MALAAFRKTPLFFMLGGLGERPKVIAGCFWALTYGKKSFTLL